MATTQNEDVPWKSSADMTVIDSEAIITMENWVTLDRKRARPYVYRQERGQTVILFNHQPNQPYDQGL